MIKAEGIDNWIITTGIAHNRKIHTKSPDRRDTHVHSTAHPACTPRKKTPLEEKPIYTHAFVRRELCHDGLHSDRDIHGPYSVADCPSHGPP